MSPGQRKCRTSNLIRSSTQTLSLVVGAARRPVTHHESADACILVFQFVLHVFQPHHTNVGNDILRAHAHHRKHTRHYQIASQCKRAAAKPRQRVGQVGTLPGRTVQIGIDISVNTNWVELPICGDIASKLTIHPCQEIWNMAWVKINM